MRKRYKNKRRSCGLCHPNKRKITHRWTRKEEAMLKAFERNPLEDYEDQDGGVTQRTEGGATDTEVEGSNPSSPSNLEDPNLFDQVQVAR